MGKGSRVGGGWVAGEEEVMTGVLPLFLWACGRREGRREGSQGPRRQRKHLPPAAKGHMM